MLQELIYTSAPKGLKAGSRGFCTVASTAGMAVNVADRLEALSGYRHIFAPHEAQAALNPVAFSHWSLTIGGQQYHVLSRIGEAGVDYTHRSNKIAHHVALEPADLPPCGPAALLAAPGFVQAKWDGEPRLLPAGRKLPQVEAPIAPCRHWEKLTGDAGWAGVLAQTAVTTPARVVALLVQPGVNLLPLFVEALALAPARARWQTTFTTFYMKQPAGAECQWRCVFDDSPEWQSMRRIPQLLVLDLRKSLGRAPDGPLVESARTGQPVQHRAPSASTATSGRNTQAVKEPLPKPASAAQSKRDPAPPTRPQKPTGAVPPAGPPPLLPTRPKQRWIVPFAIGGSLAALLLVGVAVLALTTINPLGLLAKKNSQNAPPLKGESRPPSTTTAPSNPAPPSEANPPDKENESPATSPPGKGDEPPTTDQPETPTSETPSPVEPGDDAAGNSAPAATTSNIPADATPADGTTGSNGSAGPQPSAVHAQATGSTSGRPPKPKDKPESKGIPGLPPSINLRNVDRIEIGTASGIALADLQAPRIVPLHPSLSKYRFDVKLFSESEIEPKRIYLIEGYKPDNTLSDKREVAKIIMTAKESGANTLIEIRLHADIYDETLEDLSRQTLLVVSRSASHCLLLRPQLRLEPLHIDFAAGEARPSAIQNASDFTLLSTVMLVIQELPGWKAKKEATNDFTYTTHPLNKLMPTIRVFLDSGQDLTRLTCTYPSRTWCPTFGLAEIDRILKNPDKARESIKERKEKLAASKGETGWTEQQKALNASLDEERTDVDNIARDKRFKELLMSAELHYSIQADVEGHRVTIATTSAN